MQAFLHGRNGRPNAAAENVPAIAVPVMPQDIAPGTVQPTEAVIRFFWVINVFGGNKKYECKLCRARFTGQKSTAITHLVSDYSAQRVSK